MAAPTRQASLYERRRRRLALQDPARGLSRTHSFGVVAASVDTDARFPSRTAPITFATTIEVTGVSAEGVILEFGGGTSGTKLAVSGGEVYAAAGNVVNASMDGVDGTLALDALGSVGARIRLVLAIKPAAGRARLFVNGTLALRLQQSTPEAFLNGVWADASDGSVGAAAAGTSTNRGLAGTINGAPSDFAVVAPVTAYQGQVPRQFG